MTRRDDFGRQALANLREFEVLMHDGHFDYGNGYHGRAYLNPHRIFRQPSIIWRLAQDLIDVMPDTILGAVDVVAGPVMGGALLALAGFASRARRTIKVRSDSGPPIIEARNVGGHSWVAYGWDRRP